MMAKLKQVARSAKKSAVKKISVKKSVARKSPRERKLKQAPAECCFWINNGPIVGNLLDLYEALAYMSDEQFTYHTERTGNDFTIWISDIIGEPTLAKKVSRAKTREQMRTAIRSHLK
jgi:choline kinase